MAAMNYSLNSGATWVPVASANLVINNTLNTFVITVPGGSPSLTYTPGQVVVQDANATGVTAVCGQWVVAPFNPITTPTSGTLVFGFQAANPACIGLDANGNVARMIDIQGTGQYLSIGPTAIPPAPLIPPPPLTVPAGAGVLGGTPVGPLAPYKRLSGLDNTRSVVQMKTTTNSAAFDPNSNFFDAGPLGGPNNALIQMFNTSNLTTNSATAVFACYLDTTISGTQYQGGPLWGQFETTTTVAYITAMRWHSGSLAGQLSDNATTAFFSTPAVAQTASKWMVCTLQKSGATFQIRINQGAWQAITITSTAAWSATGFSYGGSYAPSINQQSGNSFSILGDFFAYTGALNASDLANVESLIGQSIGVNLIATVPTLVMRTPPWSAASVAVMLTGIFTGTAPTSMDYTVNGGTSWTTATGGNTAVSGNTVTVNIGAQAAASIAAGTYGLRYTATPSVSAFSPGKTRITTFNPQSPATSGAALVFCTRIGDPTMVTLDGNGLPSSLLDYKTGSSQYLYYGPTSPASTLGATYTYTGTPTGSPVYSHAGGADSGQNVAGMTPAPNGAAVPNTLYNVYDAGPVGGPNDALINLWNTTSASTGNQVCVFAAYIPANALSLFSAGPIWFAYSTPGTSPNFISVGRIHNSTFASQYIVFNFGISGGGSGWSTTAVAPPYATWATFAVQKIGTTYQVRIRTSATVPSWSTVTVTGTGSTNSFSATGFAYGGGVTATPQAVTGQPYPFIGDMFCVSQGATALTEADIEGYEMLAAASVGLTF